MGAGTSAFTCGCFEPILALRVPAWAKGHSSSSAAQGSPAIMNSQGLPTEKLVGMSVEDIAEARSTSSNAVVSAVIDPPPENQELLASGLSRNQQKKQLARQARQERKGNKKVLKQSNALASALASLSESLPVIGGESKAMQTDNGNEISARLCAAFGAELRYQTLPLAFGPHLKEGLDALGSVLIRPPKYGAKFLPQEFSLLHKMWALLGGDCEGAGVVDIGAGNANCAVLAATLLGLTVVCVERESPREELRAESLIPANLARRVIRLEADVEDFTAEQLREVAVANGIKRLILVAKHPCGVGVDRSIECAARLQNGCVDLVGVVLATCCTNKLSLDDNHVSRVTEFCKYYKADLPENGAGNGEMDLVKAVGLMSRCSAWRTAANSLGNAIQPEQVKWAEFFEDALQGLRLKRLKRIFGASTEVRFAPTACTLQDRCLLAGSHPIPVDALAHDEQAQNNAFVKTIRASAARLLETMGPIDCRPKGLKSAKYGFDYTQGFSDDY